MSVICDATLPGRWEPLTIHKTHFVNGNTIIPPFPDGYQQAVLGLGCFWGPERYFWQLNGVYSTSVGYSGGSTPHPNYKEVCTGKTGHAEVVRIVFDPGIISYQDLLVHFWEAHDPTQGMRQGNDNGSQYRSILLTVNAEQQEQAEQSRLHYQKRLSSAGYGEVTTVIRPLLVYYFAEQDHQQYLAKNPNGYCGFHKTGVSFSS
ncbi:MAG: peptide-methionine (S)-S-oxide reductase MsrA [Gammaproteobacteria bacterium]|nr:peptide-methionine (S)-S-oxide reductase MsrA [Gammaproteobacteria bacterium]